MGIAVSLREFFEHLLVLLLKNIYLARRRWKLTISTLLSPFPFMFILWLFVQLVTSPKFDMDPSPQYQIVQRCTPWNGRECYDMAIAPEGVDVIDDFVTLLKDKHDISSVIRFPTIPEMEAFLMAEANWNKTKLGIGFRSPIVGVPGSLLTYSIFYNATTVRPTFDQFPGEDDGHSWIVPYQAAIDSTLLQMVSQQDVSMTIGLASIPQPVVNSNNQGIILEVVGPALLSLTIAFPFINFLVDVVNEKQKRLRLGMAMMGMRQSSFWSHWLLWAIVTDVICTVVLWASGQALRIDIITKTDFRVTFLYVFALHFAMLGIGVLLAACLQSTKTATTAGFAFVVTSLLIIMMFGRRELIFALITSSSTAPVLIVFILNWILPHFNFAVIFCEIYTVVNGGTEFTYDMLFDNTVIDKQQLIREQGIHGLPHPITSITWMFIVGGVMLVIGLYLDSTLGHETGVQYKPWLFFDGEFWGISRKQKYNDRLFSLEQLDTDVLDEAKLCVSGNVQESAVIVKGLTKDFGVMKKTRVVNGVHFHIEEGQLFCLLGHNGAGKTTTIGTLVGLHRASSGCIEILGNTDLKQARTRVGVCPQYDILWDELTPREHLTIFSLFKGYKFRDIPPEIHRVLECVELGRVIDRPSRTFSGGMKRRLSVAIANIGNPKVLFMDEPTTGMDPHSRRQVWKLIQEIKVGRSILLTTHSMEEAESLSDRVAIMAKGQLRCIGTPLHLKEKFGKGYQIKVVSAMTDRTRVKDFVERTVPEAEFLEEQAGSFIYLLASQHKDRLLTFVGEIEVLSKERNNFIKEWGVSQTTLEEVYLEINRQNEVHEELEKESNLASAGITPESPAMPAPGAMNDNEKSKLLGNAGGYREERDGPMVRSPFRALIFKNASFQKRQPCAVCCLCLFPIFLPVLMIVSTVILKSLITPNSTSSNQPWGPYDTGKWQVSYTLMQGVESPWVQMGGPAISAFGAESLNCSAIPVSPLKVFDEKLFGQQGKQYNPYYDLCYTYYKTYTDRKAVMQEILKKSQAAVNEYQTLGIQNDRRQITSANFSRYKSWMDEVKDIPAFVLSMEDLRIPKPSDNPVAHMKYSIFFNNNTAYTTCPMLPQPCQYRQVAQARISIMNAMSQVALENITGVSTYDLKTDIYEIPDLREQFDPNGAVEYTVAFMVPLLFIMPLAFFTYHVVFEKENRLRELAKMNAMNMLTYFAVEVMYDLIQYLGIVIVMLGSLSTIQERVVSQSSMVYLVLLFLGSAIGTVMFSLFLSVFINKSTVSMIVGVMFTLLCWIGGILSELFVYHGAEPALAQMFIPPLVILDALFMLVNDCLQYRCPNTAAVFSNPRYYKSLIFAWTVPFFWAVVAYYLDRVLPSTWGVRDHPLFFIRWLWVKKDTTARLIKEEPEVDDDVQSMADDVKQGKYDNSPICIQGLNKVYDTDGFEHCAVKCLRLGMENGVFGLLGPNGAGKTTTISMLCGMFGPTAGTAFVGKFDIRSEMKDIHRIIGVCPQHDIHWSKHLTTEEHLLFVARLKGIPKGVERSHVNHWLEKVNLVKYKDTLPMKMSGGEQRRLSIAMALVGDPSIVYLDEPTTGLDPTARRMIWNIITEAKKDRCIILTTHSMEEAEVLSDNIGIMANGRLRCIGSPLRLKTKFGKGIRLTLSFDESCRRGILESLQAKYAVAEVGLKINGQLTLEINANEVNLVQLCNSINDTRKALGISDWAIAQTSMEDVFMQIIKIADSEAGGVDL